MNPDWIPRPIICRKLKKLSSQIADLKLRTSEKLRLQNCGVAVAEQHCFKNLRNCDCGSVSFKLRNCDCGLEKKLRVPTSAYNSAKDNPNFSLCRRKNKPHGKMLFVHLLSIRMWSRTIIIPNIHMLYARTCT